MKRLLNLAFAVLILSVGCAPGDPESAARAAFVQWADTVHRVPYQNAQVTVIENDGAFATMKIAAEFRADKDAPWVEQEAKTSCKKVGQEWQCEQVFSVSPTARGIATVTAQAEKILADANATRTANLSKPNGLGKIAFVSILNGSGAQIFLIDTQGNNLTKLTNLPGSGLMPSWSH